MKKTMVKDMMQKRSYNAPSTEIVKVGMSSLMVTSWPTTGAIPEIDDSDDGLDAD
jgi:hypothetical protein